MFRVSDLKQEYIVWAIRERSFCYEACLSAEIDLSIGNSVERIGEFIGGYYEIGCCTPKCFAPCEVDIIKNAIFIHTYAADQQSQNEASDNVQEWELPAYRHLLNRGMINYAN